MTDPDRPPGRPGDDRLRECGHDLVMRFLALVRVGRSYQVENQAFRQQLEAFLESLRPVFGEDDEAALIALDNDLYLNGVRLPVKASNVRFHRTLMEEFWRRGIAGVRVLDGVTEDELAGFFRLFLQPDVYHGTGLLEACAASQVSRVLPAVHASSSSGGPEGPLGHAPGAGPSPDGDATAPGAAGARPAARRNYALALQGARSLLTTTALQHGVQLRHAKRVVQPLIDGAFADEPVVLGLATASHHDEYAYVHAVNVCMVAVTMGHELGLDRRALADLGVAALLHDVGKAAVYDRIRHPLEELDEQERRLVESHPLEGAKLIARSTTLNASTLRSMHVALEHHAARPGRAAHTATPAVGYPALPEGWRTSLLSGIVAVADCVVGLQTHRGPGGAEVTPYQALGMVLGPYADRFDPVPQWALVRALGFYPPGQLVELSDGRTAVVLAPNRDDLARPHVRVVIDARGVPCPAGEAVELRPLPATLEVLRPLAAIEYPQLPLAA